MDPGHGQLFSLVALIADATKVIQDNFERSSKPFVPSLDDTVPHPLDIELSSMQLKKAIQTVEGACAQLCATIARPNHTIINKLMGIYEPACLHVAVTFKIADILQKTPLGMSVIDLGERTGVEPRKLGRVLRLLSTNHCFREVEKDVFANNRLSIQLVSTNPLSSFALHFGEENNKATSMLAEVLGDSAWGQSYSPEHTAFNRWSGYPGSLAKYYQEDGADKGARFGVAMVGWGEATQSSSVVKDIPWKDIAQGQSVCDVGGGIGYIAMKLAKEYPTLHLKLQDKPLRIQQAKEQIWPRQCPEAIADNRIEFKAMDFLIESPIKGCDVYYLKNIVHDWTDEACIKILKGVRDAMLPHSRVLIYEYILQHTNRISDATSEFTQAPEPLLPNYGVGSVRQYNMDICMLVMVNSQERRLDEFITLGAKSGLKFMKLWDLGETGVVEFGLG